MSDLLDLRKKICAEAEARKARCNKSDDDNLEKLSEELLLADCLSQPAYAQIFLSKVSSIELKIIYSNKGLLPWEGGCLWIEDNKKPSLQLRKVFERKNRFLGIYSKKEIIKHEMVHAQRIHFNEPIFEEILAFQTSSTKFRRFLGPLFRNSKESLIFVLSLVIPYLVIGVFAFFFIRLLRAQWLFSRAKNKVKCKFSSSEDLLEYMIGLTDREILSLARVADTH